MNALRIGMVDLDTTHPPAWVQVVRPMGHQIVGVYDGGTVWDDGYANDFAAEHAIPTVFTDLGEMADAVDVAFVHSCNWDLHLERAQPFIDAGKAVLIDKPLAGNARELHALMKLREQGARISGGSALLYCEEARAWRETHDPADVTFAWAGCAVDDFNYGIHAYALLYALMGPGIVSARCVATQPQRRVELEWDDGRTAMVTVGQIDGYVPFFATIATRNDLSQIVVDNANLYASLLGAVLPSFADAETPALTIEPELAAVAARFSAENGGERVLLREIPDGDPGYDGAAFAVGYRAIRRG